MTLTRPYAPTRVRTLEWCSAAAMMGWGIVLAVPGDTFANSRTYDAFALIAPEWAWAAFCVVMSSLRMLALYANGAWRRSPFLRGFTSAGGVTFWTLVVLLILHAPQHGISTAVPVYSIFVAMDLISAWRSGRDFIEMERAHGRNI